MHELDAICRQAKKSDCVVVLGDFNVQLPGNIPKCTGGYVCAKTESRSATEVLNFMRRHDLNAINTKFRKRKQSHATHIPPRLGEGITRP